jgi:cation:H+ antiporter
MIEYSILIFIISLLAILATGPFLVDSLVKIARFLRLKEFVVAFFLVAIAGSLPNFFLGISSALYGIPELSLGDVIGGNLVDLTIAAGLAAIFARSLPVRERVLQITTLFTIIVAFLPLVLLTDNVLSRVDGLILVATFFIYIAWFFAKKERYTTKFYHHINNDQQISPQKNFLIFLRNLGTFLLALAILLLGTAGVTRSSSDLALGIGIPIYLVGILIVALGNALPETYFVITTARKGKKSMALGDLMGAIIVPSTLILGIVALIRPIFITDISPFAIARLFLVFSALLFLFFARTNRKLTWKEGIFLVFLYSLFVIVEIYRLL